MWLCYYSIVVHLFGLVAAPLSESPERAASEKHVVQMIALLGSGEFQKREDAARELVTLGVRALPYLYTALKNRDAEIARRARTCIDKIKSNDPSGAILLSLKSPEVKDRTWAVNRIKKLDSSAREYIPVLLETLNDDSEAVQIMTLDVFCSLGPTAKSATPKILYLMGNERSSVHVRYATRQCLIAFGPATESVTTSLIHMLVAKDLDIRICAVYVLGEIGKDRPGVVDALLKTLEDEHPVVRGNAAMALSALRSDGDRCVPALVKALKNERRSTYEIGCLVVALSTFGRLSASAAPLLYEIANDPNIELTSRKRAVFALRMIGPKAKEQLEALAKTEQSIVAMEAAEALRQLRKVEP